MALHALFDAGERAAPDDPVGDQREESLNLVSTPVENFSLWAEQISPHGGRWVISQELGLEPPLVGGRMAIPSCLGWLSARRVQALPIRA